jgi:hypothetical protein
MKSAASSSRSSARLKFLLAVGLLAGSGLITSCGSGTSGGMQNQQPPTISKQPTDQSTRVGQTATFTVSASGTALNYQWNKNGTAISGANAASYTTANAVAGDNGAKFTATISNSAGHVVSNAASLAVGPRAPKSGDWRFQGLDLATNRGQPVVTNILVPQTMTFLNGVGTPMQLGVAPGLCYPGINYDCSWGLVVNLVPTGVSGLTTVYQTDIFSNLENDLNTLNVPNTVITGLDLEGADQCFALSYMQTTQSGGFSMTRQWVAPENVPAIATQLGQGGQVVTALSFNAGQVYVISYGWQSDTKTIYETSVVSATADNFVTQAMNLAAQGYILTAMGGDPTDGLLLVGTRVQGDSLARPFNYEIPSGIQGQIPANIQTLQREVFNSGANYETWINEQ